MIICKIHGEMVLAKDNQGWIVADSAKTVTDKNGKEQDVLKKPAYFGLNLGGAVVYAAKRAAFLGMEPDMTLNDVVVFLNRAYGDILAAIDGKADELRSAANGISTGGE